LVGQAFFRVSYLAEASSRGPKFEITGNVPVRWSAKPSSGFLISPRRRREGSSSKIVSDARHA
jgi:hypothetical protein